MASTVKTNFALQPETVERLEAISKETFRGKSDVIDWLIAEAWRRMEKAKQQEVTIEQVLANPAILNPCVVETD